MEQVLLIGAITSALNEHGITVTWVPENKSNRHFKHQTMARNEYGIVKTPKEFYDEFKDIGNQVVIMLHELTNGLDKGQHIIYYDSLY